MSQSGSSNGLMSSAGLVRYFETEDRNAITIDPRTVAMFGVFLGLGVLLLKFLLI